MTKTCPNCGTIGSDTSLFCKNCGAKLDTNPSNIRTQMINNNYIDENKDKRNKYVIIGLIVLICALAVVGGVLYANSLNQPTNTGSINNGASNTQDTSTIDTNTNTNTGLSILGGSFSTGSSLSAKTYCTINVGSEHAGESVKISVLYSRDGSTLNNGNIVTKTVSSEGTISVASSYGFSYYPDNAIITLYYSDGSVADTQEVNLPATSGTQTF